MITSGDGEKIINICSLAEILDFVDRIGITIKRKANKVRKRIDAIKKKKEIYFKIINLRKEGVRRKQIWEKIDRGVSLGTLDGWIYSNQKPYYIENAKNK